MLLGILKVWKSEAMDRVRILLQGDIGLYINAWFAYRESAVLCMAGQHNNSKNVLKSFVELVA